MSSDDNNMTIGGPYTGSNYGVPDGMNKYDCVDANGLRYDVYVPVGTEITSDTTVTTLFSGIDGSSTYTTSQLLDAAGTDNGIIAVRSGTVNYSTFDANNEFSTLNSALTELTDVDSFNNWNSDGHSYGAEAAIEFAAAASNSGAKGVGVVLSDPYTDSQYHSFSEMGGDKFQENIDSIGNNGGNLTVVYNPNRGDSLVAGKYLDSDISDFEAAGINVSTRKETSVDHGAMVGAALLGFDFSGGTLGESEHGRNRSNQYTPSPHGSLHTLAHYQSDDTTDSTSSRSDQSFLTEQISSLQQTISNTETRYSSMTSVTLFSTTKMPAIIHAYVSSLFSANLELLNKMRTICNNLNAIGESISRLDTELENEVNNIPSEFSEYMENINNDTIV